MAEIFSLLWAKENKVRNVYGSFKAFKGRDKKVTEGELVLMLPEEYRAFRSKLNHSLLRFCFWFDGKCTFLALVEVRGLRYRDLAERFTQHGAFTWNEIEQASFPHEIFDDFLEGTKNVPEEDFEELLALRNHLRLMEQKESSRTKTTNIVRPVEKKSFRLHAVK